MSPVLGLQYSCVWEPPPRVLYPGSAAQPMALPVPPPALPPRTSNGSLQQRDTLLAGHCCPRNHWPLWTEFKAGRCVSDSFGARANALGWDCARYSPVARPFLQFLLPSRHLSHFLLPPQVKREAREIGVDRPIEYNAGGIGNFERCST